MPVRSRCAGELSSDGRFLFSILPVFLWNACAAATGILPPFPGGRLFLIR